MTRGSARLGPARLRAFVAALTVGWLAAAACTSGTGNPPRGKVSIREISLLQSTRVPA